MVRLLVVRYTGLRHLIKIIGMRSVNILRRSKNENRVGLHRLQQVDRAFDIRAKALGRSGGILAEMGGEVDYYFISTGARGIERAENIEMRTPRQVFSVEEATHVCAEISAAACD